MQLCSSVSAGWAGLRLAVPLKVKLQVGPSWGELKVLALDEGGN